MGTDREPRTVEEWKAAYFRMMELRDELRTREADTYERIKRLEQEEVPRLQQAVEERDELVEHFKSEAIRLATLGPLEFRLIAEIKEQAEEIARLNAKLDEWQLRIFRDTEEIARLKNTLTVLTPSVIEINKAVQAAVADERERCAAFVERIAPTEYVHRIAAALRTPKEPSNG